MNPAHRPKRRGSLVPGVLLAAGALVIALLGIPLANSSLNGKLTNSANTSATAGYFTCTSAAVGNSTTKAYLAYPLNETGGTTVADVSGNNRPGTYDTPGITYATAGPCPRDGAKAVTLNGSTGYITGAATPTDPQIFSIEIWFKTTTGGGKLIGLGTAKTGASGQYDRHMFLSNSGTLTFGVYPNAVKTVTSTATYLDGKWHDAIATLAPSTDADPGMRLYVDGALVASDPTTTGAEDDTGYWRIGYDNLAGWGANTPTNYFFTGSLAFASTYTYALTPAQVAAHYRAGT
jgi:Concanavalin A-like lectin/glucanases superfamily